MSNRCVYASGFPKHARRIDANDSQATANNATFGDEFANMLWVGTAGDVNLILDSGGTRAADEDSLILPNVIAGRWHVCPPFRHVALTSTEPTEIAVGVSFTDMS